MYMRRRRVFATLHGDLSFWNKSPADIAIGAVKPKSTHIHIVVPTGGATLYQVTRGSIALDIPHHFTMVKSRIGNTKSKPREIAKLRRRRCGRSAAFNAPLMSSLTKAHPTKIVRIKGVAGLKKPLLLGNNNAIPPPRGRRMRA